MKKTILLLLFAPLITQAQLIPTLIQGYQDPNDWNKPLDEGYIPGKMYRVDFYSLAAHQSDLKLDYHYLIETDDHFMLQKQSRYIDYVNEYTVYTKDITNYLYSSNKLVCTRSAVQKINTTVLYTSRIDSIVYSGDRIFIKDSWSFNIDSGTVKHASGLEYGYDSLNRLIQTKPYNLIPQPNTIYSGYNRIDSFSHSFGPAKILFYSYPIDTINQPGSYIIVTYDSSGRIYSTTYNMKPFPNLPYLEYEGSLYYYTQNRQYPDSIITYGLLTPQQDVSMKKIFTYTPSGNISEIITYTKSGGNLIVSKKEIYTPLLSSSVKENSNLLKQFQLMPNPNQGSFHLLLPDEFSDCTVSIFTILGEEVFKQQYNTGEVSIESNLKAGIYAVCIRNGSTLLSRNLLVQ
jgi:hypothetical protein